MEGKWKTDKWFVSPWNYQEDVVSGLEFPEKVKIHDVSLRDGEQQAGLIFNKHQKVMLAEKLAEAGVHRIEAGMPAVSEQDEAAIKEIVKRDLGPEIFAFTRCMKDDVKRAVDCGVSGIVVEIPSSEHIIRHAYRWPLQKAIDLSIEATRYAHENGLYTVFFPIDATRAEINWFMELVEKVAEEGHMDALVMVDTFGGLSPHAVPHMIRKIRARIEKPLEVHFHDDFGLGAANTIMALAAGAEVAHTTITAIGERAGNAAYEDVVLSLLTMYGVDTGIRPEKLYEVSKLMRQISGLPVRPNRAIVGDMIYKIESGIISTWYKNCYPNELLEICPFRPDLVGQGEFEVVLGKNSGADSVKLWLDRIGVSLPESKVEALVRHVKDKAYARGGLLSEADFRQLVGAIGGGNGAEG